MIPAHKMIPFDEINAALLGNYLGVLKEWLSAGRRRGKEYVVGNVANDPGDSLSINIRTGKWADFGAGIGGPDPISLFAAIHGCDRVEAAKELGREVGLWDGEAISTSANVVHLRPQEPAKKPEDDWKPQVPAPGDAPAPDTSGWDHVYPHYNEDGELLRYVVRREARGTRKKLVLPLTYGVLDGKVGWHLKHAPVPRHPFGLDRLAILKDARRVWVVMGEKKAVALQGMYPDEPVMTWTGGDNNVQHTDWSSLAGKTVVIWPDAGASGIGAGEKLADILLDIDAKVFVVDVADMADGWDCDDAISEGWGKDQVTDWVKARITRKRKAAPKAEEPAAAKKPTAKTPEPDFELMASGSDKHGVVPLGHDKGRYYYLSRGSQQVVSLGAREHTKLELMALASLTYFWERTPFCGPKGVAWDQVADHLMRACQTVGVYDPGRIRGRGAWLDEDRSVLHLGDRLLIDGRESGLDLSGSKHVYESAVPLAQAVADPLPTDKAKAVLDIFKDFAWDRAIDARLAAGWCAIAPICGALAWRPNIWITGPSGSGKSTLTSVIALLLGGMALNVQSKTSEAGIRQTLGSDARPVLFDEAEGEDAPSKARMQSVFDLVRQSTSEGGAEIVKGTANQSGAKRYRVRSCFCFSSINISLEHYADENRISVLSLAPPPDQSDAEAIALRTGHWETLNRKIGETLTPEYCAGLIARSVRLALTIRTNAETYAVAVSKRFGSRRMGDQIGALLAGAYSLESDGLVSSQDAETWLDQHASAWDSADTEIETDEQRLLSFLLQVRVRVAAGNGSTYERAIGELIASARGMARQTDSADCSDLVPQDFAKAELNRNGIRYEIEETTAGEYKVREGVWIANKHSSLSRYLGGTPWSANWGRSLLRLKGAEKSPQVKKFAHGVVQRATWLPISTVLRDE